MVRGRARNRVRVIAALAALGAFTACGLVGEGKTLPNAT